MFWIVPFYCLANHNSHKSHDHTKPLLSCFCVATTATTTIEILRRNTLILKMKRWGSLFETSLVSIVLSYLCIVLVKPMSWCAFTSLFALVTYSSLFDSWSACYGSVSLLVCVILNTLLTLPAHSIINCLCLLACRLRRVFPLFQCLLETDTRSWSNILIPHICYFFLFVTASSAKEIRPWGFIPAWAGCLSHKAVISLWLRISLPRPRWPSRLPSFPDLVYVCRSQTSLGIYLVQWEAVIGLCVWPPWAESVTSDSLKLSSRIDGPENDIEVEKSRSRRRWFFTTSREKMSYTTEYQGLEGLSIDTECLIQYGYSQWSSASKRETSLERRHRKKSWHNTSSRLQ